MTNKTASLLIIDEDCAFLEGLHATLSYHFQCFIASTLEQARQLLKDQWIQVLLCEPKISDGAGGTFLKEVQDTWPETIRLIFSDGSEAEQLLLEEQEGLVSLVIPKPCRTETLILSLKNALSLFELQRQNDLLSIELKMAAQSTERILKSRRSKTKVARIEESGIIRAPDSAMNAVCEQIAQFAGYDVSVLVYGESGTGKELAARALHHNSLRRDKIFITENCAALPDQLLESELFGHKKGAFTGAVNDHVGLFERADGGTIFLDEIGEVSPAFQVKLLRVLQEGEIRPLGETETKKINVRVIAATNKDLEQEMREGRFRKDLYFRLATTTITLPSLQERISDIPVLATYLLERAMIHLNKKVDGITDEALKCLCQYHWTGNVRELQNEMQRMLVLGKPGEMLGAELLSPRVLMAIEPEEQEEMNVIRSFDGTLKERIENIEVKILHETLVRHRWNKTKAAEELGLSRVGLRGKLERYGLERVQSLESAKALKEG